MSTKIRMDYRLAVDGERGPSCHLSDESVLVRASIELFELGEG